MCEALRKIAKPPVLGNSYREWSRNFAAYARLTDSEIAQAMDQAARCPNARPISAELAERSHCLYYVLRMVLTGKYLNEVQRPEVCHDGVEAGRRLQRRFGAMDTAGSFGLLTQILSPNFGPKVLEGVEAWIERITACESMDAVGLPGGADGLLAAVKTTVLVRELPDALQTQLRARGSVSKSSGN